MLVRREFELDRHRTDYAENAQSAADLKAGFRLACGAHERLQLLLRVLVEGTQGVATLAQVLDDGQLRENARPAGHHSGDPDQLVQVFVPAARDLLLSSTSSLAAGVANILQSQ